MADNAQTNMDRIRIMPLKELAHKMSLLAACMPCPAGHNCNGRMEVGRMVCEQKWINWLSSQSESASSDGDWKNAVLPL